MRRGSNPLHLDELLEYAAQLLRENAVDNAKRMTDGGLLSALTDYDLIESVLRCRMKGLSERRSRKVAEFTACLEEARARNLLEKLPPELQRAATNLIPPEE